MANYCSRFIKGFRLCSRKNTQWEWGPDQEAAPRAIKDDLTSDTTMSYFDPEKETELIADASPIGLGAILYQKEKGESSRA